jgi:hypothetical protein
VLDRKRPALTGRDYAAIGSLILGGAAVVAFVLWVNMRLAQSTGGASELASVWSAVRAFLLENHSPYDAQTAARAQSLAYGGPAPTGSNPLRLTFPFFLLPTLFPLAAAGEFWLAKGLWLAVNQAALLAAAFLVFRLASWKPRFVVVALLCVLTLGNLYAVAAFMTGSLVLVLTLLYTAVLWALARQHDELAGGLLALSMFHWETSWITFLLIAWRIFDERRWAAVAGFAMTSSLLLLVAFMIYPGWVLANASAVISQLRVAYGTDAVRSFRQLYPDAPTAAAVILPIVSAILIVYEWWTGREGSSRRFAWTCFVGMAVTPLLGLRTEIQNLAVLVPGLILVAAASAQRGRNALLWGGLLVGGAFVGPWILIRDFGRADPSVVRAWLFLFLPLATLISLYWTRWWFLRPQRTWLDQVRGDPSFQRGKG